MALVLLADSDTVIGDRKMQCHLFKKFKQLGQENRARHTKGTGLGLSICKTLVANAGADRLQQLAGARQYVLVYTAYRVSDGANAQTRSRQQLNATSGDRRLNDQSIGRRAGSLSGYPVPGLPGRGCSARQARRNRARP